VVEPDDLLLLGRPPGAVREPRPRRRSRHAPTPARGRAAAVVQAEGGVLLPELAGLAPAPDLVGIGDDEVVGALVHPDRRDPQAPVMHRLAGGLGAVPVAEFDPLVRQLIGALDTPRSFCHATITPRE
jgi:hypothetical protein